MYAPGPVSGVVAAGNVHTAEAAAEVLRAGGNAVDAAIAGGLAACVTEPLLASLGGAGMLTVLPAEGDPIVVDFFSRAPGVGAGRGAETSSDGRDFVAVEIDFGSATQEFHVGRASAAPPLTFEGLAEASRRLGRLSLAECAAPAVRLAREGAPLSPQSAEVFRLLWPINVLDPATTALYSRGEGPPREGERLAIPAMGDLLEAYGRDGQTPAAFRDALLAHFGVAAGGSLTAADLDVAPALVAPRRFEVELGGGSWEVLGSPRLGGRLIEVIVGALARAAAADEAAAVLATAEACRAGHRARDPGSLLGGTTHVSTLDAEGGAASLTLTNGEGCGYCVPGTGVQLNNFMGEADLNPRGFFRHAPGSPLPSAIAPTIARGPDGAVLALGSGGANRIRSVVSQVFARVAAGAELEEAILAPRVHAEERDAWLEMVGRLDPPALLGALEGAFDAVFAFPERAFFFGGVQAVLRRGGRASGYGDPRRGGTAIVVAG